LCPRHGAESNNKAENDSKDRCAFFLIHVDSLLSSTHEDSTERDAAEAVISGVMDITSPLFFE
jgi:hypothetical protein